MSTELANCIAINNENHPLPMAGESQEKLGSKSFEKSGVFKTARSVKSQSGRSSKSPKVGRGGLKLGQNRRL
jgi:hypothetical protein